MLDDALSLVLRHLTDRGDALRRFRAMDRNRDGALDGKELQRCAAACSFVPPRLRL